MTPLLPPIHTFIPSNNNSSNNQHHPIHHQHTHHNKSSFSNPLLFRSGGLLSLLALIRTGLLVVQHPSNENTCILTTTKNNFSAKASNLTYQVVCNAGGIPSIRWLGTND